MLFEKVKFEFFDELSPPFMNRTIAPLILNSLEGLHFCNQSNSSLGPPNHQVVRFFMERATKLLHLKFFADIMEFEKALDNVRIAGPLRSLQLRNISDTSLEVFFQLKKTLRILLFEFCNDLTNDGLKEHFYRSHF